MEGIETTTPAEATTPVSESNAPVISEPVEASTVIIEPTSKVLPEVDKGQWFFKLDPEAQGILTEKDKQYKTFTDYVKATHELRGKLSEKGIIPPSENATEEERKEFMEQIEQYIPDPVPENYELEALKNIAMDDDAKSEMFNKFREMKLSNEQADALLLYYGEQTAKDLEVIQAQKEAQRAEAEKVLKADWGAEFEQRIERASTVLERLGEGFGEYASENGLFTQPQFVKMLDKLATAEAVLPKGTSMSKSDIQSRIDEIKKDPAFFKGNYFEREKLSEELRSLIEMRNK